MKNTGLKYFLAVTFISVSIVSSAQNKFKKGEDYQREVLVRSNCVLQRGAQTLHVSSASTLVRSYKVTDANLLGAVLAVSTIKLVDTINAMDQSFIYSSAKQADPSSMIQLGLQNLAKATLQLNVDNKGEIKVTRPPVKLNDTLVSFSGIQAEYFKAGTVVPFLTSFTPNVNLKKGYTWQDKTPKAQTTFTVYALTPRTITITYKASKLGESLNTRENGTIVIDNNTGLIIKRYAQSVSTGYEMVNGVVYTATRRTAITETCVKKGE
ncbi:hypothetical protein [Mucilaginibacter auburnensis]|uniref:Uncharacterized protein n=1 Tax=Mucilaginibacter auburnensis TaxID=1457233 RepID=A0A2H9VR69_9SPHI|nr:hypothetical protein [Mucilaginibacter auburnensis]PJJ83326.1 hypothetical protein CLV57_0306 [Mucilaginibacter auburnensis]